jgi:hypothetical protein
MLPSSPSLLTVSKYGNGFQMPGVVGLCGVGMQLNAWSLAQSGSVPFVT